MAEPYVECSFLIPMVRDSDKLPHRPRTWKDLRVELRRLIVTFPRGHQGPREVVHMDEELVPGEYQESAGDAPTHDRSRKYWIALPKEQIGDLRALLRKAANTFDQRSVYLSIAGAVEFVEGREEDGLLNWT